MNQASGSEKYNIEASQNIDNATLPELISNQVKKLDSLDDKIKAAKKKAEKAKRKADSASKKSANRHLFHDKKREAIESLQESGMDFANALESSGEALTESFEFQKQLAHVSKGLFVMGLGNLVHNRTVVRELELKLQNASEEEISDLARQELIMVIKQLKQQQDLLRKQESLSSRIRELKESLDDTNEVQTAQNVKIDSLKTKDEELDKLLALQIEKDKEHDDKLKRRAEIDERQDIELASQAEKDREHESILELHAEKDRQHDTELKKRAEIDKKHDQEIKKIIEQLEGFSALQVKVKILLTISVCTLLLMAIILFTI